MGSGKSDLYFGTYGAKPTSTNNPPNTLHSKEIMQKNVHSWAVREKNKLSKTQQGKFNTACVVYDCTTGKRYYGRNNGIDRNGDKKNPLLFGKDGKGGILPKSSLNHLEVGRCAEVDAVNRALNNGAKLENLYMMTIYTRDDMFGQPKKACLNCTYTFKGKIKENHAKWFTEE